MTARVWINIRNTDMRMSRLLDLMARASAQGFAVWLDGDAEAVMVGREGA